MSMPTEMNRLQRPYVEWRREDRTVAKRTYAANSLIYSIRSGINRWEFFDLKESNKTGKRMPEITQRQQWHGTHLHHIETRNTEIKNEIITSDTQQMEKRRWKKCNEYNRKSVNATVVRSPCGYVKYSPVLITLNRLWFGLNWWFYLVFTALKCTAMKWIYRTAHTATEKTPFCMIRWMCVCFFFCSTSYKSYTHTIHRPLN